MENGKTTKYSEKLARYILIAAAVVLLALICRTFSKVLIYIAAAGVVSLIAQPLMALLRKIRIKGKCAPDWLLAIVSILLILLILSGLIAGLSPVVKELVKDISEAASGTSMDGVSENLAIFNAFLRDSFNLESDFRIEMIVLEQLKSLLDMNIFGNVIGSVASAVASIGIGVFSVVFISFFFIKDEELLSRMICALTPDRLEGKVTASLSDVEKLLSRYFIGLIIEMSIVGAIDFLGLWAIARLDFETAIGIGFLAGMLNIIPYVGPLLGGAIGTVLAITIRYCSGGSVGLDVNFWLFLVILICIFAVAQLVDNFILQPLIYSASIKASPLEIFIVLLMAGTISGVAGMLVAIPAYTVIRVVAARFFPDTKLIRRLVGEPSSEQ